MFAHVATAQVTAEALDGLAGFTRDQLPAARQQPGFRGFYLLSDPESGHLMTISLWETQEHMQASGVLAAKYRTAPPPGITGLEDDTYEVIVTAAAP